MKQSHFERFLKKQSYNVLKSSIGILACDAIIAVNAKMLVSQAGMPMLHFNKDL